MTCLLDTSALYAVLDADDDHHQAAMCGVLSARRKDLILVDCVSFATMRQLGVDTVFTFDRHFREQGFVCRPSGSDFHPPLKYTTRAAPTT